MRAREFVINVPINIKINDDEPEISVNNSGVDHEDEESQPILKPVKKKEISPDDEAGAFVPPLQQKIELMKAAAGKQSKVISQLVADEDEPFDG